MSLSGSVAAKNGHTRFGSRWTRKVSKLRAVEPIDLQRLNELLAEARANTASPPRRRGQ